MAGLEDFSFSLDATLADFAPDQITPVAVNKPSSLNLAAHAAALSGNPDKVIDTYRIVNAELEADGRSDTADAIMEQTKQEAMKSSQRAVADLLADPSYTDEQKRQMAFSALDETHARYNLNNNLSVKALAEPVKNESVGAEISRLSLGEMFEQTNDIKNQQQIILNREMLKYDTGAAKAVADFVGYIIPFAGAKVGGEIASQLEEGGVSSYAYAAVLAGSNKEEIRNWLESVPPEERVAATEYLAEVINNASTIVLPDGNSFAAKDYLQTVIDQGAYDTTDKWVDNVFSILDVIGLGGVIKGGVKALGATEKATALADKVNKRLVKSRVQPVSIGNNYKDANSDKAKATFALAMTDETEEASQALYGADKNDVASDTLMPEFFNEDGTVMAKVGDPDRLMQLEEAGDLSLLDYVNRDGKIYYFQSEKANAVARTVENFQQAIGMNARKEMFQVAETGEGASIRAVYGPPQGGYTDAEDAINMAKWSLRDYNIPEENIKLLVRFGPDYRVASTEEMNKYLTKDVIKGGPSGIERQPKDFLVSVDYDYSVKAVDVTDWEAPGVSPLNIFDRLGVGLSDNVGSLTRHLFDPASLFHPTISKSAAAAVDKAAGVEKRLLDSAQEFADLLNKTDPKLRDNINKVVRESNEQGREFDYNELAALGLRDAEMKALKKWREHWDDMYRLENADAAKTLRARNYYEYVDETSDTRLFAKPIHRTQTGKVGKVFDPTNGQVRRFTDAEVKSLYDTDGTFAQLRRPMIIGDEAVDFIVSTNAPGKNYLRAVSDTSQVLNYRKGYYAVKYTDPYFIVKRVKNSRGEVIQTKAVATASGRRDAEALAKTKASADGAEYFVRQDIKGSDVSLDDAWDVFQSRGRSAQRVRGERLEEPDSYVTDPSQSNILDPVDSMIAATRSLSHRVAMRDMLETTKQRFMKQYEEFLPTGEFGQKVLPGSVKDLKYRGLQAEDAKKLGDARTTFEYIRYLENGYINHIDDAYKVTLKGLADIAGHAGLDKGDEALRWLADRRGPAGAGKNAAFTLYLALNPLRQFIVQSHQAVQLLANFPRWFASGEALPQLSVLMSYQAGIKPNKALLKGAGLTEREANQMFAQFRNTGQVAAIDKQNLVRGSLLDLADQMKLGQSKIGRVWRTTTAPITWSRKVGFDAGELVNTMTSWLAHRDDAIRNGRDMSRTDVQADVAAAARNYTYNMNAAGDQPYNQNFMSLVFQFMQVPHKAMLTMLTNRQLTKTQKVRLIAFNSFMYTLPPAAMYDWFGPVLPENPEAREAVVQGFEGYLFNTLLSQVTDEESSIDFSGLSPMDMYGTYEFIRSLWTLDPGTVVASTPSGQLLFGNNPRITNFAKTAARYFNLVDDYQDPTSFGQVAHEFASMSSGYSNLFKAAYALEYSKKYGILGTTNSNIPTPNAIAMVFGFQSLEDAEKRWVGDTIYRKSKEFEEDVKNTYRETKRHVAFKDRSDPSYEVALKTASEAWRVLGNDNYLAKDLIDKEVEKDLSNKDLTMFNSLINRHEIFGQQDMHDLLNAVPFESEEKRQQAKDLVDFMKRHKEEE